ncbi:uracil-DNA glycosylase [Candidatus Magnetaquicoccus inordinatus]|uniref:uracil-DNA glycosylase n=1 Tax=Candidatus Magnetaquicoccus inordinatus TaxID=2496818 RepID=UPI00102CD8AB|nr:uracil-DNA glycosylase [Candidatus Magnetaquicoccus inordinatus]
MSTLRRQPSQNQGNSSAFCPPQGGLAAESEQQESVREATGYGEAWRATLAYWIESGLLFRSGDSLEFLSHRQRLPATVNSSTAHSTSVNSTAVNNSASNAMPHAVFSQAVAVSPQASSAGAQSAPLQASHEHAFHLSGAERQLPMPEAPPIEQRPQLLQQLAEEVAACQKCRLSSTRSQTVFGVGSALADIVLVGEAPGAEEDQQGEPFVGAAGKLLEQMLKAIGRKREEIFIANVIKCRPPANRDPQVSEIALCQDYLFRQLEIIQPKVIFCLGRFAILCLTGHSGTVGSARAQSYHWRGIPLIASYHPAFYLRAPSRRRDGWHDLLRLLKLLEQ